MHNGELTKIDIHWYGAATPYSNFKPSSVPPPVGEEVPGYRYCYYNLSDTINNLAYHTKEGEEIPLPPSDASYTEYTADLYSNISNYSLDYKNNWEVTNGKYVNLYYKFKINPLPTMRSYTL